MRTVNRAVSTIIPFVLLGLSGFCSYVFIGSLCSECPLTDVRTVTDRRSSRPPNS